MRNRRTFPILIVLLTLLLVSVSVVSANQVAAGQVGGDNTTVVKKMITTWELKSPGMVITDLNSGELEVISEQQSQTGEQYDYIPIGKASTYLFYDGSGTMRIHKAAKKQKACDNRVIKLRVKVTKEIVCPAGPAGKDGRDGANGANGADSTVPGPEGPQGPKGDKGDTGTGITNNYWASTAVACGQIGGQSPYQSNSMQLMSLTMYPMSETNISVSATATGGQGGAGGNVGPIDIINNNANNLVSTDVNNNVIAIDGTATGTATGEGNGVANAGNHP